MKKTAIIFGGTGFIGLHFSRYLLDNRLFEQIILADIKPPQQHVACQFIAKEIQSGQVRYEKSDVRDPIQRSILKSFESVSFIANFAAIHREPGHEAHEYYETNIPGARNVCEFADIVGCNDILFTSSIAPYSPTETPKDEATIPTPETAYGGSKFAAELIHSAWVERDRQHHRLLIVRPGVVFGPGEGGNVSRLVEMIAVRGFFVFAGNEHVRKAGIYVKELCNAMWWMHELQKNRPAGIRIVNMTMNPGPSMKEYVSSVKAISGKNAFVPSIPPWLLMSVARIIQAVTNVLGINSSVNVVRVRKLIRSNNIVPSVLRDESYRYIYTLDKAMQDWKAQLSCEWGIKSPIQKESCAASVEAEVGK
jgi:nucleoside-diphosphate-sugar epimerase